METIKLTLVIPVYNREKLLPRTLASVAGQTCRAFRLILVDNGSTDNSWAVCQAFRQRQAESGGPDVTLAREEHPGAARARNRGLALCTTPYIYFFDSDDEMSPDFVATLLPELADEPDVVAFTTVQTDGRTDRVRAFSRSASPAVHILNSMLSTQAMLLRTDFLRAIGGWDESLRMWNDWELGVRVLLARPRLAWYTRRPFHRIYLHPESLTGNGFSETWPWLRLPMQAALTDVRRLPAESTERRRAETALYYRYAILCGQLRACGKDEAAELYRQLRHELFAPSALQRAAARLLYAYAARGGRGAWRLALALL